MQPLSVAVIVIAVICLYNSLIYIIIFTKSKQPFIAWFALTCLQIAGYDLATAGLYNADNFVTGLFWQRLQFATLNLVAISFLWFFWTFLQIRKNLIPTIISSIFLCLFFLGLTLDGPLTLSITSETPRLLSLGSQTTFEVYEGIPGLIYLIEYIAIFVGLIFLLLYSLVSKSVNLRNSKRKIIFMITFVTFTLFGVNDIFVGLGLYHFIYLIEYGYLFILFFMTYLLLDEHLQMFNEVSNLNTILEKRVKDRTEKLEKKIKEVQTLSGLLPICSSCKKIRDGEGYWNQLESYISKHSEAEFSHGICQECSDKLYGDQEWYKKGE